MKSIWIASVTGILLAANAAPAAIAAPAASPAQAATPAAPAAQPIVLQGDVKLEKTVVQNGVEKLVLTEPKTVVPGDRLVFSTSYRNAGTAPVEHFVVTNPIPSAVVLAAESANSLEVSVDGGKSWGLLATRTVTDDKGMARPAQAADITHVRWTLPVLAPGANGKLTYHAIVR
jgi:uncharacterized repeat protein (TIGR01451 family)